MMNYCVSLMAAPLASDLEYSDSLPTLGQCPWQVIGRLSPRRAIRRQAGVFFHLQRATSGSGIANTKCDQQIASAEYEMLGELVNLPTDTLIDMLYTILAAQVAITASDAAEIEQIQRELQRRGGEQCWSLQTLN